MTAVVIAAVWFWTSSPRAEIAAAPGTVSARQAERLPATASAQPVPAREDVEVTAAIPAKGCPLRCSRKLRAQIRMRSASAAWWKSTPRADRVSAFEHFKQLDFLTDKEVVLTFDDGPWPVNTPSVLKALADECTKAVFFPIGKHATYHPEILRQVAAAGHTVGAHTWSHANLNSKKMTEQQAKDEIEKGFSAVKLALGAAPSPFLSLSATAAWPRGDGLSRVAQRRDVFLRRRLL